MGAGLVIGVDGGGTKTRGMAMHKSGRILADRTVGPSNPHAIPHEEVGATLVGLLTALAKDAGTPLSDLDGICLSMAGVDRPADKQLIESLVRPAIGAGVALHIVNDAYAGIMSALERPHGLMLISGTGSVCFAFDDDRSRIARCGGWGQLLGDEGSGYSIGLSAMKAVIQAFDGRRSPTALTDRILPAIGATQPTDMLAWLKANGGAKADIAALSRHVHELAQSDDAAAEILEAEAGALVSITIPPYRELFADAQDALPIVFGGSNIVKGLAYRARVERRLAAEGLRVTPTLQTREPAEGAARYALLRASQTA